jgi:hypothetical protein
VVHKAKQIADAQNTSVSAMFSQFVESMAVPPAKTGKIGPLTRKLSGVVKLPAGKGYRDLLTEALADKYGVGK